MKTNKENNKITEGLGILLMIIGVSMVGDFSENITNWKTIIPPIIACGGWLLYAFSERLSKLK